MALGNASERVVPRTRVQNVGQDGHHAELVLLTRLLGDVLTDDLGPETKTEHHPFRYGAEQSRSLPVTRLLLQSPAGALSGWVGAENSHSLALNRVTFI